MKNQYIGENYLKKRVRLAQFADLRGGGWGEGGSLIKKNWWLFEGRG